MQGGAHLTFYGVRGSTPCDGRRYERYGGNTSCVALEVPDHRSVIFDLGTGLREYGNVVTERHQAEFEATGAATSYDAAVLLSHLHWDHIIGLPFFLPAYQPDATIDVYGPGQGDISLAEAFEGVMRPPYFPISTAHLDSRLTFFDAENDNFAINGAKVRSRWIRHTDPTLGYRVDVEGVSVAYVSDHGPGCNPGDADDFVPEPVLELCDGVDVLIHDAQHTCAEYSTKRHFGHSTIDYAVHVAREAAVRQLVLFHHCPTHSDDDIDQMLEHARNLSAATDGPDVIAAAEGLSLPVTPR